MGSLNEISKVVDIKGMKRNSVDRAPVGISAIAKINPATSPIKTWKLVKK